MAFNLADMLKNVSEPDTGREQIVYIPLDLIDQDPNNFYELSEIPALADNISMFGLQQPIRVREATGGRYTIVSGHRRRAALQMLVDDGYERFREASCIVESGSASPALQQLRLIYANSGIRKLTSAELGEQARQVEKLLYQLKEEGYEFPGRMRDHVAEAVKLSKSKLARLKVIREHLAAVWVDAYRAGDIGESSAYALAQIPSAWQEILFENWGSKPKQLYADTVDRFRGRFEQICKTECDQGLSLCEHSAVMMRRSSKDQWGYCCSGCCVDCASLPTCKQSCPQAEAIKKEKKAVARKAELDSKAAQEERDRPGTELARLVWQRIGQVRKDRGISIEQVVRARGEGYYSASYDDKRQEKQESGSGEYKPGSTVSLGHGITAADLMNVIAVADLLECSVDYLLGRTDRMDIEDTLSAPSGHLSQRERQGGAAEVGRTVPELGTYWRRDDPPEPGTYLLMLKDHLCDPTYEEWQWDGTDWKDWSGYYNPNCDGEILGWMPMPKLPEKKTAMELEPVYASGTISNENCITGMSPSGHCGAAAYCSEDCTCCLQCDEDCSVRCGWCGGIADGQ